MLLAQCLAEIRRAEQAVAQSQGEKAAPHEEQRPAQTRAVQHAQPARQTERMARYEQISTLRQQGWRIADIAAQVGMGERTVRNWLTRAGIPHSRPRRPRARLIDPYTTYLTQRWNQGCHNGLQLERELRAQGYKGSQRGVYRYASDVGTLCFPECLAQVCSNTEPGHILQTVQSAADPLCAAGHLALFP